MTGSLVQASDPVTAGNTLHSASMDRQKVKVALACKGRVIGGVAQLKTSVAPSLLRHAVVSTATFPLSALGSIKTSCRFAHDHPPWPPPTAFSLAARLLSRHLLIVIDSHFRNLVSAGLHDTS